MEITQDIQLAETITVIVTVNRERSPQEALVATGREHYGEANIPVAMPNCEPQETKVTFFKFGNNGYVSNENLDKRYESLGLQSADPYVLAAVNEADPAFADNHRNATCWKDAEGNWHSMVFGIREGKRSQQISPGATWWGQWWFCGVPKNEL